MNNPNPFLVPQGVFLDHKNKARTRLKIAVYSSISLSVFVLMVLLFQGCKKPNDSVDNTTTGGDSVANTQQLANPAPETTSNATALSNPTPDTNVALPPASIMSTPPPAMTSTPPPPVAEMQEYTIVQGDTLSKIHDNFKVSVSAIMAANPGINPKNLKIGQKIKIPAPTSTQSTSVAPMAADTAASGGTITYKVKSGDTLDGLHRKFHVSIKAIQSANNLNTTRLNVGQVLKIPAAAAPAPTPETAPPAPLVAPSPAPASTSAPAPMH